MTIPQETKKKLIRLGVPEDRHDAASLAALFPPEFKMTAGSLSAAELASVFVTFVEHGLISAPKPFVRPMMSTHVCHFYRSDDELLGVSAAFLEEGLRGGERCLWVMPTWIPVERARATLRAIRPQLDEAEASGRLAFFDDHQVHLEAGGEMADPHRIIAFWLGQERQALARGFRGLRIAGDGTALVNNEGWSAGVDYERQCDDEFRGRKIVALCSYSVKDVPAERLARVLSTHAVGISQADGWTRLHPGVGSPEALEHLCRP